MLAFMSLFIANPVAPPPADPVSAVQTFVKGSTSSAGPVAVGAMGVKVVSTMVKAADVGSRECRQLSSAEAAFAPIPVAAPVGAGLKFTKVAWLYDQLPLRKEALWMRLPMPYPSVKQMLKEIKRAGLKTPCR